MDHVYPTPVRTLLVSDVHLGCKHSQAKPFLEFLQSFAPETIYLVGDFIDGWKINGSWHWSRDCDDVISHLIALASRGTKVFYVPGNHDAFLRNPAFRAALPAHLSQFEIANEFVFETILGWRLLVTHGDMFDCVETKAQWASKGSSLFYDTCLTVNWWIHRFFLADSQNPYGICGVLKNRVKRLIRFLSHYESQLLGHAKSLGCDGIVCGHVHTPDMLESDAMWYFNTGDWVENCTGLVERHDGQMQLIQRFEKNRSLRLPVRCLNAPTCNDLGGLDVSQSQIAHPMPTGPASIAALPDALVDRFVTTGANVHSTGGNEYAA